VSTPDEQRVSVRHEEELLVSAQPVDAGHVRIHKTVESQPVSERVGSLVEAFDQVDRAPAEPGDSGEVETLPDGSISIPILEEQLVITKRLVVRERIIVRKTVTTLHHVVEADLRSERVNIEGDVTEGDGAPDGGGA
jgi:uncharacterized protein (TIGR02271 family)